MAIHYRTQGIFLKKTARGEADELFTIYTKDFGKLKILGKAIRKIASKLRGGAEPFYLSDIEFIQGKTHKTLTDVILVERFPGIRGELIKLKIAYAISGLLDDLVIKEEKDEAIWELLIETFEKLNNCRSKTASCKLIYYYFFWNLFSVLGYHPEISGCSIQGKKIDCDIIKILKVILKKDWQILPKLKIEPCHQKLLKNISQWYKIEVHDYNYKK